MKEYIIELLLGEEIDLAKLKEYLEKDIEE
jgi:hypothetical protein